MTRIAIDTSKAVFTVHGVDAARRAVLRRNLRRRELLDFFERLPAVEVALEACGGSHHRARARGALGHRVRLLRPQYVKPFVRRSKNDRNDAEAVSVAARRARAFERIRQLFPLPRRKAGVPLSANMAEAPLGMAGQRMTSPKAEKWVPGFLREKWVNRADRIFAGWFVGCARSPFLAPPRESVRPGAGRGRSRRRGRCARGRRRHRR